MDNLEPIVDFLFEAGMLAKTPRSGFHFLGSGQQSVAEHINRVILIGYVLVQLEKTADLVTVLKMCIFHDLPEARTSDLNYVHQKYTKTDVQAIIAAHVHTLPFGDDIETVLGTYEQATTIEAQLAKDADQLEWILSLKEEADTGSSRATTWIPLAVARLKTVAAKRLADKIITTPSDHWWFNNPNDGWWVNRDKPSS